MKYLHIVPGADDVANGMARVARLLAKEQGDAEVVDLNRGKWGTGNGELGMGSGKGEEFGVESLEEVWVHGMWLPKEWAICRRVIKAGKRLVRMTHGSLSPVYLKQQGRWKKRLVGPIERYWLRKADRIVATCDAEKEWIEAYLGKKCPEIAVEDIKRFFKLNGERGMGNGEMGIGKWEEGANNKKLNVLYLGRRHPLKGVRYLEEAVKELVVSRQSLVVSEKDLTKSKLETRNTKPETRNIELKIVSNAFGEELEKVWEWCDVLVLPTLSENFGLVVAEALERGKRVITTDGAPVWGELGNGEWGRYPPSEASPRSGCPSRGGNGEDVGDRLVYLNGFRDGSDAERVRLLKDALMMMV
ncbi:MAG: glycosyltransferase [Kiritimatiellae bacterium]|nr:glycosyltransferase [Kiritimatiellia bacterium]